MIHDVMCMLGEENEVHNHGTVKFQIINVGILSLQSQVLLSDCCHLTCFDQELVPLGVLVWIIGIDIPHSLEVLFRHGNIYSVSSSFRLGSHLMVILS